MMRLLICGAGVIGGFYAALFSRAGYNTTVYARGKRLGMLERAGLLNIMASSIRLMWRSLTVLRMRITSIISF